MPDRHRPDDFGLQWIGERTGTAERRQVVILAIGFEPALSKDPEDIAETLARRRALVARIAARYGGSVARTDPGLQLVCWGWPVSHDADARLAVAAALEIARDCEAPASCGLDAGIAIAPENERANDGLVCEALQTSISYQTVALARQVILSDTVSDLVDGFFETEAASGLSDGRRCWSAKLPSKGVPEQPRAVELVGRTVEAAKLEDCWREVMRGRTKTVCIAGGSGMGKSALAAQLARRVTETGGWPIAVSCLPERQQQPGWIAEQLAVRLRHRLESDAEFAERARVPSSESELLQAMVSRVAEQSPLAIILADAHWIDTVSASAIAGLAEIRPLMLVETRWTDGSGTTASSRELPPASMVLELSPLPIPDIEALVRLSDAGARLSPKNLALVCEHAEGNPLYALELARLCVERPNNDAHHRLLSGPNRLNAHLTSRLDALVDLKPLVQAAAVLGRLFDARVLAAVLEIDPRVLNERLQLLVQNGILSDRRDRRADRYRFRHALMWSQAYGSVLKSRRRELHLKMAVELNQRFDCETWVGPESIAHHWKKAGRPADAFGWWARAARQAAARGDNAVAIDCIHEALAAKSAAPGTCKPLQEAELMSLLARELQTLRGRASPEAVSAYESASCLLKSAGGKSSDLDLDIAWGLASIHLVRGDVKLALHASGKLIGEAEERGRADIQVVALRMHGTANLLSGRIAEAIDLLAGAVLMSHPGAADCQSCRHVCDPTASALAHLASANAIAGHAIASRATRQRALERAELAADAYTSSNVLGVLALGAIHLGEIGPAAALARASGEIATRHGYKYWAARAVLIQAWVAAKRAPGRGMAAMQEALDGYRSTGAGRASVIAHCLAAEVALEARQPARALALLTPFRNKGHLQGEWLYIPELLRLEAAAHVMLSPRRRDEGLQLLGQAEAMSAEHGSAAFLERIRAVRSRLSTLRSKSAPHRRGAMAAE